MNITTNFKNEEEFFSALPDMEFEDSPKLIGVLTGWACEEWIEPAIKQAIKYCDEVFVCIGAHSDNLLKFEDRTAEIAYKYKDIVRFLKVNSRSHHAIIKAGILNFALKEAKYNDIGNWVWILDSDEFYDNFTYKFIKFCLTDIKNRNLDVSCMSFDSKYFYINMYKYILSCHDRVFKITSEKDYFRPTQSWTAPGRRVRIRDKFNMFHYGMCTDHFVKEEQWKSEYPGTQQNHKVEWLNKIFKNYDLNDEDYWIQKNYELSGTKGPFIVNEFSPDENGRLYTYNGKHPKFIEESGLTKIRDFREFYNEKNNKRNRKDNS